MDHESQIAFIINPTVSLNDIAVFGSMLKYLKILKQQFFSTGCLKYIVGEWVNLAKYYKENSSQLCSNEAANVPTSKFNILEYIMHFRGTSTGLAKRRSLWDKYEPLPKKSFTHSMKVSGASAQQLQHMNFRQDLRFCSQDMAKKLGKCCVWGVPPCIAFSVSGKTWLARLISKHTF